MDTFRAQYGPSETSIVKIGLAVSTSDDDLIRFKIKLAELHPLAFKVDGL